MMQINNQQQQETEIRWIESNKILVKGMSKEDKKETDLES